MIFFRKKNRLLLLLFIPVLFILAPFFHAAPKGEAAKPLPLDSGVFLVASYELDGSYFRKSVILLTRYDKNGTSGLIINRPSNHSLAEVFPGFKLFEKNLELLYVGGPLMPHIPFLLMEREKAPKEAKQIFDQVYFSANMEILSPDHEGKDKGDEKMRLRVYGGYAGWAPGQLEAEISKGAWRLVRADAGTIFDSRAEDVWEELMKGKKTAPDADLLMVKGPPWNPSTAAGHL